MMKKAVRIRHRALAVAFVLIAGAAAYFAHTAASASDIQASPLRPFAEAGLPSPDLRSAVLEAATRAGVDASALYEAGATQSGQPYRATIIGADKGSQPQVAFLSDHSLTTFVPARSLLATRALAVVQDTAGTPIELRLVGLTIVARTPVVRVDVQRIDSSTETLPLTAWSQGPYASAAIVAADSTRFPTTVFAYDGAGRLIDEQAIDLNPIRP